MAEKKDYTKLEIDSIRANIDNIQKEIKQYPKKIAQLKAKAVRLRKEAELRKEMTKIVVAKNEKIEPEFGYDSDPDFLRLQGELELINLEAKLDALENEAESIDWWVATKGEEEVENLRTQLVRAQERLRELTGDE